MTRRMSLDLGHDLGNRPLFAFGIPRRVGRIAPVATQVAAARSHENRRYARQHALTLNGIKNFRDQHPLNKYHCTLIPADGRQSNVIIVAWSSSRVSRAAIPSTRSGWDRGL